MKIGIYGDSFGLYGLTYWPDCLYKSWTTLIKEMYPETDNFCVGGSSLFYSYTNFYNTYKSFDKIIFLVTSPARKLLKNVPEEYQHAAGIEHVEYMTSIIKDIEVNKIYSSLKDYIVYVQDYNYEEFIHNLILKQIYLVRSDILFIPCFENSVPANINELFSIEPINPARSQPQKTQCSLHDISKLDVSDKKFYNDGRHAHLNVENNQLLFYKVNHWIETGNFSLNLDDFTKSQYSSSRYFF